MNRYPLYFSGSPNFGDAINPVLYKRITGEKCVVTQPSHKGKIIPCGSIIQEARPFDLIWGAGSMCSNPELKCDVTTQVLATRGPLSSELLYKQTKNSCDVYGDPGLLLSRFFAQSPKQHELGIIPHYTDRDVVLNNPTLAPYYIDIMSGVEEVIKRVTSCHFIVSSALHGIICAEAFNIPALWVEFSDNVAGNGYKFCDYYTGTHRYEIHRIDWRTKADLDEARYLIQGWEVPNTDLDLLLRVCPFNWTKTDYMRWREVSGDWIDRNKVVANLIDSHSKILEFGAGRQLLSRLIPVTCSYTPSDIIKRTPNTIVCDLNAPLNIDLSNYDTLVASGVLEYVEKKNINKLLKYVKKFSIHNFICTYSHGGADEMRSSNGWVNNFTRDELLSMFSRAGFVLTKDQGGVYKFTR